MQHVNDSVYASDLCLNLLTKNELAPRCSKVSDCIDHQEPRTKNLTEVHQVA